MESEVGVSNNKLRVEGMYPVDSSPAGREEACKDVEEGEVEVEVEEYGDDGIEEVGEEGRKSTTIFEGVVDPLEFVGASSSEVQLYQRFQRIEHEALAKKKRKCIELTANEGQGSVKKPKQEDNIGATLEEVAEFINLCDQESCKKLKKSGRRKGSRNNLRPEITKRLGEANIHYALGCFEDAISLLREVVRLAPNLPDAYHMLGLVYNSMGEGKKATDYYLIAAILRPKDASLWKRLVTLSIEQKNCGQALYCISRAITADPADVTLLYSKASLYMEEGNILEAAESYNQIVQIYRNNVEALKRAAMLYKQCGRVEHSISILEDYLNDHPTDAALSVIDMLASSHMERNDYTKALQHIEHAERVCGSGEFPSHLTIKKGICHAHLADMEKAKICFSVLDEGNAVIQIELVIKVANSFADLQQHESALKYYLTLEGCESYNGLISSKIAYCYWALKEAASAIQFFYKALGAHEDDIDARLTLASLLFEENREDEAIQLLSAPPNLGSNVLSDDRNADTSEPWWLNVKVKLKLSQLYKSQGMVEAFVGVIYPLVYESLKINSMHHKAKGRKSLSRKELLERVKVLGDNQTDSVIGQFRRPASKNDVLKANRAKKKLLEKRTSAIDENTTAVMDTGLDWESDDSEVESPLQPLKEPPWPDFFKDEEHYDLISDLCKALASLRRYDEALELITLRLKITSKTLPAEKTEKFRSLGAQIAINITDPSDGLDYARYLVLQRPQSKAAWNCFYKLLIRLENRVPKHNKFLHYMRLKYKNSLLPMIISGNQYTSISQHQIAAREYLEAYKQMPLSPLINLCAGTALVNLALGLRIENKHQCLAQGLAFLYNNLLICENSQEAIYNVARACHHVGLISLATSYYEKVLAIHQHDHPLPKIIEIDNDPTKALKPGYCDLRREAAYNLHLIYKNSGAFDLARQILRNYCTL